MACKKVECISSGHEKTVGEAEMDAKDCSKMPTLENKSLLTTGADFDIKRHHFHLLPVLITTGPMDLDDLGRSGSESKHNDESIGIVGRTTMVKNVR